MNKRLKRAIWRWKSKRSEIKNLKILGLSPHKIVVFYDKTGQIQTSGLCMVRGLRRIYNGYFILDLVDFYGDTKNLQAKDKSDFNEKYSVRWIAMPWWKKPLIFILKNQNSPLSFVLRSWFMVILPFIEISSNQIPSNHCYHSKVKSY